MDPPAPAQDLALLFEESSAAVYRTARRITGRPEDAEDVLQNVFLSFVRHHGPGRWPEQPLAWLRRAAVNASLDVVRRRKRRPEDELDDVALARGSLRDPVDVETLAAARLDGERLAEALREALGVLSPLEAEVFTLRFVEELGNAEIAEAIGKTANHVGVTLHAARRKLREALALRLTSPGPSGTAPPGDAS
jgi:RNA polymerase sigma-70 factor (ECF subfamily)